MDAVQWSVVVPAKRLDVAKTRLRPVTAAVRGTPVAHGELVLGMLADTVEAALGCTAVDAVLVVTDDPAIDRLARRLGAVTASDEPAEGLNPALVHGAARTVGPVAALSSDLPALRPDELGAALAAAGAAAVRRPRAFVPDASGRGTTLLTAVGVLLDPHFGADSAAAHAAGGALRLRGNWPGLRQDVDTGEDLRAAAALGPGPRTRAVLDRLRDRDGVESAAGG